METFPFRSIEESVRRERKDQNFSLDIGGNVEHVSFHSAVVRTVQGSGKTELAMKATARFSKGVTV